jgi:hypothetical protein
MQQEEQRAQKTQRNQKNQNDRNAFQTVKEGNAFYEVDLECVRRKQQKGQRS